MQGTERPTTGPYKAIRGIIGVRGVLTIPYEAYIAICKATCTYNTAAHFADVILFAPVPANHISGLVD